MNMVTITIPKKLAKKGDLVVMSREDYEALHEGRESAGAVREFTPAPAQKKALARARRNLREGKSLEYDEFAKRLAALRRPRRS